MLGLDSITHDIKTTDLSILDDLDKRDSKKEDRRPVVVLD
jgi:hypothetical protein